MTVPEAATKLAALADGYDALWVKDNEAVLSTALREGA